MRIKQYTATLCVGVYTRCSHILSPPSHLEQFCNHTLVLIGILQVQVHTYTYKHTHIVVGPSSGHTTCHVTDICLSMAHDDSSLGYL